jgi:hypothetical protein
MDFDVRVDGKPVIRAFGEGTGSFQAALMRNYRDILPEIADKLIATVRAGNWFTNESGNLKKKLYRSAPRITKSTAEIDVGWAGDSAVYGPVLETGPNKKTWTISPKTAKNLRWVTGGKVHYAKQVTINWTPASLRPHIAPAMDKIERWVDEKMDRATVDARRESGLE